MTHVNRLRIDARYKVLMVLRHHNIQATDQIMKELSLIIDESLEAQSVIVLEEVDRLIKAEQQHLNLTKRLEQIERNYQIHNTNGH
jgi:NADPH-dependent curcumin reductase CurA